MTHPHSMMFANSNLAHNFISHLCYPLSAVKQLLCDGAKVFSRCVSCWVSRSSNDWWIVSMWFSRNISLLRNDSSSRLKAACTSVFACSHVYKHRAQQLITRPASTETSHITNKIHSCSYRTIVHCWCDLCTQQWPSMCSAWSSMHVNSVIIIITSVPRAGA